jgi:hypothetical protein
MAGLIGGIEQKDADFELQSDLFNLAKREDKEGTSLLG